MTTNEISQTSIRPTFDAIFREKVAEPILNIVPHDTTPNFITFVTVPVRTTVFLLSFVQCYCTHVPVFLRCINVVVAGALFLLHEIIDDPDGMQARKTGQTSKFGEIFDHVLDAYGVPILGASFALPSSWTNVDCCGLWGPTLIYFLQLVSTAVVGRSWNPQ